MVILLLVYYEVILFVKNCCPIIVWYGVSAPTLKHRSTGRARACRISDTCSSTHLSMAREGSRRSRYSFTVSVERVETLNERLSHHRMVLGQRSNTQTPPYGPRARVPKLRYMLVHATSSWLRGLSEEPLFFYSVR